MQEIKKIARSYFFVAKNTAIEKRREAFEKLHVTVKKELRPIVDICAALDPRRLGQLPWNVRRAVEQINDGAWRYLLDVGHFTRPQAIKIGKKLSLHAKAVACIVKNKAGKDKEFGRVFQLRRLKGNFFFVMQNTSLIMNDKKSLPAMLAEHIELLGKSTLKSVATDKGYWALSNKNEFIKLGVKEIGLQKPANIRSAKGMHGRQIAVYFTPATSYVVRLTGKGMRRQPPHLKSSAAAHSLNEQSPISSQTSQIWPKACKGQKCKKPVFNLVKD